MTSVTLGSTWGGTASVIQDALFLTGLTFAIAFLGFAVFHLLRYSAEWRNRVLQKAVGLYAGHFFVIGLAIVMPRSWGSSRVWLSIFAALVSCGALAWSINAALDSRTVAGRRLAISAAVLAVVYVGAVFAPNY